MLTLLLALTPAYACHNFSVTDKDGATHYMRSTLIVAGVDIAETGAPGYHREVRVGFSVPADACAGATVTDATVEIDATDYSGTGWALGSRLEKIQLRYEGGSATVIGNLNRTGYSLDGSEYLIDYDSLDGAGMSITPGGTSPTYIGIWANSIGASTINDDILVMTLTSLTWSDGINAITIPMSVTTTTRF